MVTFNNMYQNPIDDAKFNQIMQGVKPQFAPSKPQSAYQKYLSSTSAPSAAPNSDQNAITVGNTTVMGGPAGKIVKNIGQTFLSGVKDLNSEVQNEPKLAALISTKGNNPGLLEHTLAGATTAGHLAGTVGVTTGGIISSAISPLIQDSVKQNFSNTFFNAKNILGETNGETLAKLSKLADAYPELAKSLGDVINTYTLMMGANAEPAVKEAASGLAESMGTAAKDVGEQIATRGAKKELQTAIDAVKPELKGKQLATHYLQDFGAEAQKSGILKGQTSSISPEVERVATELKDTLTSKDPLKNLQSLGTEMNTTEGKLSTLLENDKTPVVKDALTGEKGVLEDLKTKIPREYRGIKEQQGVFESVVDFAKEKINEATPDVKGLREARSAFDAQTKMEFPSAYKNGYIDVSKPAGRAIKLVRDSINNYAYSTAEQGSELQRLIGREADIFKAAQNIAPKVASKEGKNIMEKFFISHPLLKKAAITGATILGGHEILKKTGF